MSADQLVRFGVAIFMVFIFVLIAIVAWQKSQQDRERIRNCLLDKGYREIEIRYEWFDFDKSNSTYTIECRHPEKGRVRTSCKIHNMSGFDEEIFWKDPL